MVERIVIESVAGDTITFEVDVRGGAERLARALRFAGLLEEERIDTGYDNTYGNDSTFGPDPGQVGNNGYGGSGDGLRFFYEPR